MTESQVFKAAVVQAGPVPFDTPATLARLETLAHEAAAQGASLVVFPEAFVGGYPKGSDFGVRLGTRSPEGREQFRLYHQGAIEVEGPDAARIAAVARECRIHLVVGVIERDGGTLYCTALMYAPDGTLLGRHRKLVPTALERVIWGQGDGSTLTVADSAVGRLGAVICWENYMPLLRMAMYGQGVELYCAPTVDDRDTWLPTMRAIAVEGRCFVLSACQFVEPLIRGGSCIIDPFGTVLAEPVFGCETIRFAAIDRRAIPRARFDLNVTGHYARPDVFRFEVNRAVLRPVRFRDTEDHDGQPA